LNKLLQVNNRIPIRVRVLRALMLVALLCAITVTFARIAATAAAPVLDTGTPVAQTNTGPDDGPDAIWRGAMQRSAVSTPLPHRGPPPLADRCVPPTHTARSHRGSSSDFTFSRPHDPPHLHPVALLI
jgi:hypothetical protein